MIAESKRKEVIEGVKKGRLDVIGLQEMHMKGCGVVEYLGGNECGIWEGIEGVVWCGVDEKKAEVEERKGVLFYCPQGYGRV